MAESILWVIFLVGMAVTAMPAAMADAPASKEGVTASPSVATDNAAPVSGTPSIVIDMVVAANHVLAAFTAQKQNAVATGPTKSVAAQNAGDPSPVKGPSKILAPQVRISAARVICHGASVNAEELALKWRKCTIQKAQQPAAASNIAFAPRMTLFDQSMAKGLTRAMTPITPSRIPKVRAGVARSPKKPMAMGAVQIGVV
ncbi:hypothetical protein GCM10023158_08650 [Gluconacetobacter tumulicola]